MTDNINEALEALRNELGEFCEEHDLEKEEAEFNLEISLNLEFISSATINGLDDLIDGIEEAIKEMDAEAMLFFISPGDESDTTVRIGLFREAGTWFAWM